jgi:quinol monooxygenase YgiN
MKDNKKGLRIIVCICLLTVCLCRNASGQQSSQVIHLAKLHIDPVQLETYKAALKEEIETSARVEPGVLTLYAVSDKSNPANITVFEIYADTIAYKAHLETPHFKKYKSTTKGMVQSLELIDVNPVVLAAKPKL